MARIEGLYTVLDPQFRPDLTPVQIAREVLAGGGKIIQLRMKGKLPEEILPHAHAIASLKSQYDFTFIINDHAEIAKAVLADGVHVGQDDAPVAKLREQYGKDFLIGYSSHNVSEAEQAAHDGADYVAIGAVFPTSTKTVGHHICGLSELNRLVSIISIPVVAIGGIKQDSLKEVLSTGVRCVAMITEIIQANQIRQRVVELKAMWK